MLTKRWWHPAPVRCLLAALCLVLLVPPAGRAATPADGPTLFAQGKAYEEGKGADKDEVKAFEAYEQAAKAGYAPVMEKLASMYLNGTGTRRSDEKAVEWARKAVALGQQGAMVDLGWMYGEGRGVPKDLVQAVALYRKAADASNVIGTHNLGACYANGSGVSQDMVEAIKWYRKAAENGYVSDMYSLGMRYLEGEGVREDHAEAARWFHQAAAKGDAHANTALSFCLRDEKPAPADPANSAILDKILPAGTDPMRGFNDVKLGITYQDVQKQCGRLSFAKWPGWMNGKDEQSFVFCRGKLVAYQKTYRGDNDGWVDKLTDTLGPVRDHDKIAKAASRFGEGRREDVAAWYDFHDSTVNFDAAWNHQPGLQEQFVTVAIFDRAWLLEVQNQEITRKREALKWVLKAVSDLDSGVEAAKLEPLSGTTAVSEVNQCVFFAKDPEDGTPGYRPKLWVNLKEKHDGRPMAVVRRVQKFGTVFDPITGQTGVAQEGTLAITVDLDPMPELKTNLALVLVPLRTRMNMELAKELVPNGEGEYFTATYQTYLYPAFYWKFGKGWSIRVGTDNMISLLKSPNADKKL